MAADLHALVADLQAETAGLEQLLGSLADADWQRPTPAPGWRIHDQVSHLAYFDEAATLALTDPDGFLAERADALADPVGVTERVALRFRDLAPAALQTWFGTARAAMVEAFLAADPAIRVPWFGPSMSPASSLTARIMETWAHGRDIADALGATLPVTPALRHVAYLGVRALPNSFATHDRPVPDVPVQVSLDAPDGTRWEWGEPAAADRVEGPALDFCLVVTQRIHLDDTALRVAGPVAREWMGIAQAFAGGPGAGRAPRSASA